MPSQPKPLGKYSSWEECDKLLSDPGLFRMLNVRLVQLAMTTESAVATRAIEMLHEYGQESVDGDLSDIPTSTLEAARTKAVGLIQSMNGDESGGDDE
jgi:hypothetical protein